MAGAFVAMLLTDRPSLVPPVVVVGFFTIGGIMNLSSIPHPSWFPIVDLPVDLILATVAGLVLKRRGDQEQPAVS